MANIRAIKSMHGEKKAVFEKARAEGRQEIAWYCATHGTTSFLVASGQCKACKAARNANTNPKRKHLHPHRLITDPIYAGKTRERTASADWRKNGTNLAPGFSKRNMPAWNKLEKEALQKLYQFCAYDKLYERDHLIPCNHKLVTGLHCWVNIVPVSKRFNRLKGSRFSVEDENNRWHRPANRYPGGAFDPHPTAHEWELVVREAEEWGTPPEVLLAPLRAELDRRALECEAHAANISDRLINEK